MTRPSLLRSGALGLLLNAGATGLCIFIVRQGWLPALLPSPWLSGGLFIFLALISLAEIPLMIFGMRKMLDDERLRAGPLVAITHGAFVFFAAVYAAPQFLLTASLGPGLVLSGLGLIRWAAAYAFLQPSRQDLT